MPSVDSHAEFVLAATEVLDENVPAPDGSWLAAADRGYVRIWETGTGDLRRYLTDQQGVVISGSSGRVLAGLR